MLATLVRQRWSHLWCCFFPSWLSMWEETKLLCSATKFVQSSMTAHTSKHFNPKNYTFEYFWGGLNDNVQSSWDLCGGDEEGRWKTWLCSKESVQLLGGRNRGYSIIELLRCTTSLHLYLEEPFISHWLIHGSSNMSDTCQIFPIVHLCPDFQACSYS